MEKIAYGGWPNCVRLSNSRIELVATTDVGPRLIRLGFVGERNLFKEWPDQMGKIGGTEWRIYGGHRLWHAPEVKPRSYSLDNGPVAYQGDEASLKLTQSVEPDTGLQKEIEITLDAKLDRILVVHRLFNRGCWPIEVAPWALSVMQGPGRAIFPQEPYSTQLLPVRPLVLWGYTDMSDPRWSWGPKHIQLRCDPALNKPQKVGMLNKAGWAAYNTGPYVFLKRFDYDPKVTYPDYGCNCETYTRGDMIEVETLGPLTRLTPGAVVEHAEQWFLFKAKVTGAEQKISEQLLPLVRQTDV